MKPKLKSICYSPLAAIFFAGISPLASAADQTYDAANATNAWDLSTLNWDASAAAWTNGNNAIFGGTAETVPVNAAVTVANLTFNSANYIIAPGTGSLSLATGTSTVTVSTGTSTITAALSGMGTLSKSGSGNLTLSGANTYSGGTTLAAGTGKILVSGTGTGVAGAPTAGPVGTGIITLSGGNIESAGATVLFNNITATAGTTSTIGDGASGLNLDISGNISGSGTINCNSNNAGFDGVRLFGDNSGFTGTMNISGGGNSRHKFASATAGSAAAKWILNGGTDSSSMAFGASGTIYFGELSGSAPNIRNNSPGTTATLNVGALNTNSTWGGVLTNINTLALTKVGTGTLTITGANTYNGATAINGGKLDVTTGSIANTPVTVNSSGSLQLGSGAKSLAALTVVAGGTAKFNGTTTVAGALSAVGADATLDLVNSSATSPSLSINGTGGLTLGGAAATDTAKIKLEAAGSTADSISTTNLAVDLGGVSITVSDLGVQANQVYTLVSFNTHSGAGFTLGTGTTVGAITLANPSIAFGITGTLEVTDTAILLHTSGASAPFAAYWSGAKGGNWTDNSGGQGNFKTSATASTFLATNPGSSTAVYFSSNSPTNLTNTLGGNFDIYGLTYRAASAAVTTTGSQQLILEDGGITVESGNGGATLGMVNLLLPASQTWTNDSSHPLTVSATNVSGPSASLALAGTGGVQLGGSTFTVASLDIGTNLDLKGTAVTADLVDSSKNITNTGAASSTLTANISNTTNLSGIISDSGAGAAISITKNNSGTLTLSGANSYGGGTSLNAGTLIAGNDTAFGSGAVSITATGATLDLNGKSLANALNNSGAGAIITNSSATPAIVSTGFNSTAAAGYIISDFTVNGTGDITWDGAMLRTAAVGVLTKSGANTLIIHNDHAVAASQTPAIFSGMSLKIEAGTVYFGKTTTSIQDLIINGGTLKMDPNYQVSTAAIWAGTIGNTVTMNGGTWDLNDSGTNGVSNRVKRIAGTGGTITNSGSATGLLVLAARDGVANNPTWPGNIQDGTGKVALTITNGGSAGTTMTFSGNNTYSGATNIFDNTLRAGSVTGLSPNSAYILANNANSRLDLADFTNSIGSLAGGVNSAVLLGAATLTTGADGTSTTFAGAISGTGGLVKSGGGSFNLTGANTYLGDTTAAAGILAVDGSAIPDTNKLIITGGKVEPTGTEIVNTLFFGATLQAAGTYGATGSGATFIDDVHFSGTGKVSVTTGAAGYSTWAANNAGGQAANLDYDNDGVQNGIEYFMGATGSSFTANPTIVNGKITWPKDPAFTGSYTVQISNDLVTWTNVASTVVGNTVEYTLPTGQAKIFVRLDVTPN